MIINVGEHTLEIVRSLVNELEVNITKVKFEFPSSMDGLTKKAFFTQGDVSKQVLLETDECDIPSEVLTKKGQVRLGVIAYEVVGEVLKERYNPTPCYFNVSEGSLIDADNTEPITPSDKEQIEQAITNLENNKQDKSSMSEYYKKTETYSKSEVDTIKTTLEGEIPTKLSQLQNDENFIDKSVNNLENYTKTSDLSDVALSGSYNDLSNKPNLSVYSLITETGNKINLEINSSTYVLVAKLYDKNNNLISTSQGVDLPLETMVVGASYDSTTKEIVLTLKNGQTTRFSVADLVSGLQTEITSDNKLSSDLVDDTGNTHKFVSQSEKTSWNNKSDFSGNYNDLTNKPDLTLKEDKSNKVSSISSSSTDTQYPTAKCVYASQEEQNTQIEELQEENTYLNSIINQLPRVNSTGSSITLDNTIEAKMKSKLSPSEMEQETTTGKNKLNYTNVKTINTGGNWSGDTYTWNDITFTLQEDGGIKVNGTASAATYLNLNNSLSLESGSEYILNGCPSGGGVQGYSLRLYTGSSYESETGNSKTFTYGSQDSVRINIFNGTQVNNQVFYPMIRLSSVSDATYEKFTYGASPNPQYPQDIHTTTGDNTLKVEGSLFDDSTMQPRKTINTSGVFTDYDTTGASDVYIPVQPNTEYIYECSTSYLLRVNKYTSNKTHIERIENNTSPFVFTTDSNCYYVRLSFYANAYVTQELLDSLTFTFNKYPYTPQTYPLTLGTLEYSKIGNYEDEFIYNTTDTNLELNKWYLKKNIDKIVFDGSETWSFSSSSSTPTNRSVFRNREHSIYANDINYISNRFIKGSTSSNRLVPASPNDIYISLDDSLAGILSSDTNEQKLQKFKTYISTNNIILCYPVVTPTYIPLNDTLQEQLTNIYNNMMSKKGQTNISQVNDDLPMVISASALLDLNTLIGG